MGGFLLWSVDKGFFQNSMDIPTARAILDIAGIQLRLLGSIRQARTQGFEHYHAVRFLFFFHKQSRHVCVVSWQRSWLDVISTTNQALIKRCCCGKRDI